MILQSRIRLILCALMVGFTAACGDDAEQSVVQACIEMSKGGLRPIADDPSRRFKGKVSEATARCRGGENAVAQRATPWVDWSNYWATGDAGSLREGREAVTSLGEHLKPNGRGIDGSLMDLEYQRIELIKFNLFDNYTYETYVKGEGGKPGSTIKLWPQMRLRDGHPQYVDVGGSGPQQCSGELIRYRTLTGICNDLYNPLMGATGTEFARNVEFESTFPLVGDDPLAQARHSDASNGHRLGLYHPDPQLISRKLLSRPEGGDQCNNGNGLANNSPAARCSYQAAPFFNVLAAFWIQFMTHDWFSHLAEGRNRPGLMAVGCESREAQALGCRPDDQIEPALYAREGPPERFEYAGRERLKRAPKTTSNNVTAWWDASQIYGYDDVSLQRVIRDSADPARLRQPEGYLPSFEDCSPGCPTQPQWRGQEATAFPDNWNIGLSFLHNLFVREHNSFVDHFRQLQRQSPERDSGLRNPADPARAISYGEASDEEIFQAARLVVAAMIAKIHTVEWTPQLLYDEPLYRAMNSNWFGLFNLEESDVSVILRRIFEQDRNVFSRLSSRVSGWLGSEREGHRSNAAYSVLASGAGIFGLNNRRDQGMWWWQRDGWDLANPAHVNGGTNHFGSPFNFPEEFTTVYRLHPLVPDLIDYRELSQPNVIKNAIPMVATIRAEATRQMRDHGIANWGLSLGRQRLGALTLENHPRFLQNFAMPHLASPSGMIDVPALDILRDRERGVPRFNEFRRQIGLQSLRSFDDFVDQRLPVDSEQRRNQQRVVNKIREVYGTHVCDDDKVITRAQRDANGELWTDCLGHPPGSRVDNIEDVDMVVGWLAEYTRPHGYAISETQFHIFIINASRRLFSDRFFTSSFRPEFYSNLGYDWVLDNGPLDDCPFALREARDERMHCEEPEPSNGHRVAVSPMKRVLMRNIPELRDELMPVVNAFDPWARSRGQYYSLDWTPRKGAESDAAFGQQ